jgi:hypothetical protein
VNSIKLITTKAAERNLLQLDRPLDVQLELLFSCVIRKRVLFRIPEGIVTYPMANGDERVNICFRPVMTKVCLVSDVEDVPDMEDFPIQRINAFMPRWLQLDFRKGEWRGDFGWLGVEYA